MKPLINKSWQLCVVTAINILYTCRYMYMYMHKQSMNHIYVCIIMHVWLYVLHRWYVVQISKPSNPGSSFRFFSKAARQNPERRAWVRGYQLEASAGDSLWVLNQEHINSPPTVVQPLTERTHQFQASVLILQLLHIVYLLFLVLVA